jgi:hypothetical protein
MFVFDSICIIFGGTTKSSTPLSHLRNQCCGKWSPNILAMHSWCFTFLARSKCITKLVPSIWWTQKEDPGFHLVAVSISGGFNPSPVPVLSKNYPVLLSAQDSKVASKKTTSQLSQVGSSLWTQEGTKMWPQPQQVASTRKRSWDQFFRKVRLRFPLHKYMLLCCGWFLGGHPEKNITWQTRAPGWKA